MKKGLVLEGGSMRGMFTCGILDVFMENGITFDTAVGVSAGAAFGINLKSHQHGRPLRYNKRFCCDPRYASLRSFIKTGDLFNVGFCYKELPFVIDIWDTKTFYDDPMEFFCVATDINTGKAVYHKCDEGAASDIEWIRASASIPLLSRPVEIDGHKYLDGGMSDSIPLKFMEKQGADRIIVIETQPGDFIKTPPSSLPLIRFFMRKYPKMVLTMENRHMVYNDQKKYIRAREETGEILVLRPEAPLNIGSVVRDPYELQRVYNLGRREALKRLDEIKRYLG